MSRASATAHQSLERTIERGVEQTLGYMEQCGAEEGHLVVIDRGDGSARQRPDEQKSSSEGGAGDGRRVTVWRL